MVDTINPNSQIPDSSRDDENLDSVSGPAPMTPSSGDGFYTGFDRPDSTRVNLAGDNPGKIERIGNAEYDRLVNQKLVGSVPPEKDFDNGENLSELNPVLQETKVEPRQEYKVNDEEPKDILEGSDNPKNLPTDPAGVGSQAPHFAPVTPQKPEASPVPQKEKEPLNIKAIFTIIFGGIIVAAVTGFLSYYLSGVYYDKKLDTQKKQLTDIEDKIDGLNEAPIPLEPSNTTTTTIPITTTTIPSATTTTSPAVIPSTTTTTRPTTTTTTKKPITPTTTVPGGLG